MLYSTAEAISRTLRRRLAAANIHPMSDQDDELIRRARQSQEETQSLREETERELGGDDEREDDADDADAEDAG
jgi:hypothetical protein